MRAGIGPQRDAVLWRYALDGGRPRRQERALKALADRYTLEEEDPSAFFRSPDDAKNPYWEELHISAGTL